LSGYELPASQSGKTLAEIILSDEKTLLLIILIILLIGCNKKENIIKIEVLNFKP
jgi:hypothetical protein